MQVLRKLSPSEEDKKSFDEAEVIMLPLRQQLELLTQRKPGKFGENYLRLFISLEKRRNSAASSATKRIHEVIRSIEGFDQNHLQFCNELIYDGLVGKISGGKRDPRQSERHAYLFDGMVQLCKPMKRSSSLVTGHGAVDQLKPKEKFLIRNIKLIDHPDPEPSDEISCDSGTRLGRPSLISTATWQSTTSLASTFVNSNSNSVAPPVNLPKNCFEIQSRDNQSVILFTKTPEEKQIWMSNLLLLSNRSMLERQLDSIMGDEEKKVPLESDSIRCLS